MNTSKITDEMFDDLFALIASAKTPQECRLLFEDLHLTHNLCAVLP